ncbi:unnamed protein product [Ranitomeya imitator]|uniref:Flotillin n=1 Tax=Ranitomeya imitator TaxID=111125 RepID=A0ABN9MIJ0_9NEOB|nr:unnamed protein product [Ranitomeya imitator]
MKLKAGAYQHYGEAAKMALVLECLPQIAAKVSAPLAKVDEIVILSGENSKITGEMNRLLAEVPVSIQALTGVDLTKHLFFGRSQCDAIGEKSDVKLFCDLLRAN